MAVEVSYDRQTINTPNPIARFAHRRRMRKSESLAMRFLPDGGVIVDFGAGPGTFLSRIADRCPGTAAYAIEPFMANSGDARIRYVNSLGEVGSDVDVITSLEVCEHLTDEELDGFTADAAGKLKDGGVLIVSVPIQIGIAIILKEVNRALLFRRRLEYSVKELVLAVFGMRVNRPADRKITHKGFDFRRLREQLSKRFIIERELLSPLPLPWWANSQIFFVCRKR